MGVAIGQRPGKVELKAMVGVSMAGKRWVPDICCSLGQTLVTQVHRHLYRVCGLIRPPCPASNGEPARVPDLSRRGQWASGHTALGIRYFFNSNVATQPGATIGKPRTDYAARLQPIGLKARSKTMKAIPDCRFRLGKVGAHQRHEHAIYKNFYRQTVV